MAKNVHSKDPRKPAIVAALKIKSGGTKITDLRELNDGRFEGDAYRHMPGARRYFGLGRFIVTPAEVAQLAPIVPSM